MIDFEDGEVVSPVGLSIRKCVEARTENYVLADPRGDGGAQTVFRKTAAYRDRRAQAAQLGPFEGL